MGKAALNEQGCNSREVVLTAARLKLVTALMTNTKGEGQGGDPFWDKAERLLLVSLIAYLHYEAPVEEQNFATLLEMLNTMQVSEDDETYQNPVDKAYALLETGGGAVETGGGAVKF